MFSLKHRIEMANAQHDQIFVPMHLARIPVIRDKYDLMVANGLYDFIIDSVARSEFSKQYIKQLKFKENYYWEERQRRIAILQKYFDLFPPQPGKH